MTPRGLAPPGLIPNGDFGEMKRLKVPSACTTPRKNLNLSVNEPGKNDGPSLDCTLMNYIDTLTQRINYHIGNQLFFFVLHISNLSIISHSAYMNIISNLSFIQ